MGLGGCGLKKRGECWGSGFKAGGFGCRSFKKLEPKILGFQDGVLSWFLTLTRRTLLGTAALLLAQRAANLVFFVVAQDPTDFCVVEFIPFALEGPCFRSQEGKKGSYCWQFRNR